MFWRDTCNDVLMSRFPHFDEENWLTDEENVYGFIYNVIYSIEKIEVEITSEM